LRTTAIYADVLRPDERAFAARVEQAANLIRIKGAARAPIAHLI
jgi:hypothetical protein